MKATIYPSTLNGTVTVPPSKAIAHRALICAALSDKPTKINASSVSDDVNATIGCLSALGAKIRVSGGIITVNPIKETNENAALHCCESGSTLRFIMPVAAALGKGAELDGTGRLPERPIEELCTALRSHGVFLNGRRLPIKTGGKMHGGRFTVRGDISSQFISGLLLALPLTGVDSYIVVTGSIESKPYIEMTIAVMRDFGVEVSFYGNIITVRGGQNYSSPGEYAVEADWSGAAFFLCANAFGENDVNVYGLTDNSTQGDSKVAALLEKKVLNEVNVSDIPDLVPVLAAISCFSEEKAVFAGASRLRLKESDRLESTAALVNSLGGHAEAEDDRLIVYGTGKLRGGTVDSFGDHRIVMAAAIAAAGCEKETVIHGCEAVSKSFPDFFEKLRSIGGNVIIEGEGEK